MIKLERTCWACPEQYDAYDETGKQVGYLRLRHGRFSVTCPGPLDLEVYHAHPKGDGIFDDDEREYYLKWAVYHIQMWLENPEAYVTPPPLPAPDVEFELVNEWSDDTDFDLTTKLKGTR